MRKSWAIPVLAGILILGTLSSQDAFAFAPALIDTPRIVLDLEYKPSLGVDMTITPNRNCQDDTTTEPADYLILKRTSTSGDDFFDSGDPPISIIDRITAEEGDCEDTHYLDNDVAIGELVRYKVVAFNSDFDGDPEDSGNNDPDNRSERSRGQN